MTDIRQLPQSRIFAATWLSYAGFYFCRKNFSIVMPLLARDEGFRADQLAQALFFYSLAYVAGQFSSGMLSDRLGPRRVVVGGMLLSAVATAMMGFADSLVAILACQAVNGYAQACGWPGLLKMMAARFGSSSRGVVMGWWCTNYVAGGFLATLFATWAATGPLLLAFGWRRGAWGPALVLAAMAIIFWFLTHGESSDTTLTHATPWSGLAEVVHNRAVLTIAAMYFTVKLARYVFLFWLPFYMTQGLGYGAAEAGYTSSIFEFVGFGGVVLAGYVSDHAARGRRFPVGALMMFLLSALCLAHPLLASTGRWGNIIGISFIGMMTFGADALMAGAGVQDVVRREVTATAGGFTNAVGSLGQVLSPFVASMVSAQFGWNAVFYVLVVITLAGGCILATQWNFVRDDASSREKRALCSNTTSPSSAAESLG